MNPVAASHVYRVNMERLPVRIAAEADCGGEPPILQISEIEVSLRQLFQTLNESTCRDNENRDPSSPTTLFGRLRGEFSAPGSR